jgi:Fe-S-cluster containining protein
VLAINAQGIVPDKPAGEWCPHCRPGKGGCSRYNERPAICSNYLCLWRTDERFGPEWYPTRSRMVLTSIADERGEPVLFVACDPGYPARWREEPYHSTLREIARHQRVYIGVRGKYVLLDERARSAPGLSSAPVSGTPIGAIPLKWLGDLCLREVCIAAAPMATNSSAFSSWVS